MLINEKFIIVEESQLQQLEQQAQLNQERIEQLATEKAAVLALEQQKKIRIHMFNDRHDYDDDINVCISSDESIAEQLKPVAQSVEYWVKELVCGRTANYQYYKRETERLSAINTRLFLGLIATGIIAVLGIIFWFISILPAITDFNTLNDNLTPFFPWLKREKKGRFVFSDYGHFDLRII